MKLFLQRHAEVVTGVLSGFDRLVLRGSLRLFVYAKGLLKYLCHRGIKLKDFGRHSRELSDRIIAESQAPVERVGRPVIYLPGSQDRKDDIAREIAQRDRIEEGTICVLKTVESAGPTRSPGTGRPGRSNCVLDNASVCTCTTT